MKRILSNLRRAHAAGVAAAKDSLPDAMLLGGAASVAYGAGLIYAPAGYIVGGVLLLAAGWLTRGASA